MQLINAEPNKAATAALILKHIKTYERPICIPISAINFVLEQAPEAASKVLVNQLSVSGAVSKLMPVDSNCSADLGKLAEHPNIFAKAAAARHRRTPMAALKKLALNPHPLVQAALRMNSKVIKSPSFAL